jgi:hypothetical protein
MAWIKYVLVGELKATYRYSNRHRLQQFPMA